MVEFGAGKLVNQANCADLTPMALPSEARIEEKRLQKQAESRLDQRISRQVLSVE
jgi:hypothetical protein